MNDYELVFIVQPNTDEVQQAAVKERVAGYVTASGGEILNMRDWGMRRLAYPIRKLVSGLYVIAHIRLDPSAVANLQRELRLNEDILRGQIVRTDEVAAPAQ
jgi:small subunit ribosomal protein S6